MGKMNIRNKTVAVVGGAGHSGLPLSLLLASKGLEVFVIDHDEAKLELLRKGQMPFMEEGADQLLVESVN